MKIDNYSLRARIYPAVIVLLPVFILSIYYITDVKEYYHYFTSIFSLGIISFLLSQLGRDSGKRKEKKLHNSWGGTPTTVVLRHSNNYIDQITKSRYHKALSSLLPDIIIPDSNSEKNDLAGADNIYNSCAKFLISKTRDNEKYNLLFKENINYGFRRNLWGMKFLALVILSFSFLFHIYIATDGFSYLSFVPTKDLFLYIILVLFTGFWLFIVTRDWIRIPAFAYAERLYETLNDKNINS